MKYFFALNEDSTSFADYSKMLKTAVYTAQKFTRLEPHFLYDGGDNELTEWLTKRGVKIIKRRTFLYDDLRRIADARNDPNLLNIGAGAFLRTEIPRLAEELGFADRYVLYTDVDILFLTDPTAYLESSKPKFFAVAPESDVTDYQTMNTGIMLMNIKNLQRQDRRFRKFMQANLEKIVDFAWDQGAYKLFYNSRWFGFRWDKLPPEYNWKPYWGDYSNAKIVHFHGAKPFHKDQLAAPNVPEPAKPLLPFATGKYFELTELWENYYAAATGE